MPCCTVRIVAGCTNCRFTNGGTAPEGERELGSFACAMCHTRVMPDGTTLKGAQVNLPFDRAMAVAQANDFGAPPGVVQRLEQMLYSAPWLHPDPFQCEAGKPSSEIASIHAVIPPGVLARHRARPFCPVPRPDRCQRPPLSGPGRFATASRGRGLDALCGFEQRGRRSRQL